MNSSTGTFTYWSLLGLTPGSDLAELKKAFRSEARRWHPDLNHSDKNAEERLKWINKAYDVLSDPKKRFEWEVSGRPTFEIKSIADNPASLSNDLPKNSLKNESGFSSSEKLLIALISILAILALNRFF